MAKNEAKNENAMPAEAENENALLSAIGDQISAGGLSAKTKNALAPVVDGALNAVECLRLTGVVFNDAQKNIDRFGKIFTEARHLRDEWQTKTGQTIKANATTRALYDGIKAKAGNKIKDIDGFLGMSGAIVAYD